MTALKLLPLFLLICFVSCGQKQTTNKTNPAVVVLTNKIIPLMNHVNNPDSCRKALSFLDSATAIDTNCYLCYYNKLMFLYSLKEYKKATIAINNAIRIKPYNQDLYSTGGILYKKINDTITSKKYFEKSLSICNNVLDTMNIKSEYYFPLASTKAVDLIMLGNYDKANELLKRIYDAQTDDLIKQEVKAFMNKDKDEIIDMLINPEKYEGQDTKTEIAH